jgi:predicted dehydrogenase
VADIVKIGVVGAGSIAVRGIMPHLSQEDVQDRVRIWAICDPVEGRAQAAVERFGGKHAFESYDDLLAKGEVDAVTIASPIGLHYEQGKKALEAGKHIHFNKTMTTTVAEATDLIDTAKKKGLKIVASPGMCLRPHLQQTRKLIEEGAIGTPVWAACGASFGAYHEQEGVRQGNDVLSNINPSWYWRKPGGGPLYDMTVYALHSLTTVLGPAKRVTAMSGVRIKEREFRGEMLPTDADDNTLMVLDFGASLYSVVYGMAAGRLIAGRVAYFGTGGSIVGDQMNGQPLDFPGREEMEKAHAAGNRQLQILPHVVGPHKEMQEAHVYEDIMQLVDWIREGKPTPVTAEQARHVVDIIESGYRSAETGQAQELTTTF